MIDNERQTGHTVPESTDTEVAAPSRKASIKHIVTAIAGLPVMFIILMAVSTVALIFTPSMMESFTSGESVSIDSILQDSSFLTFAMLLQCLVFIVVPLLAVLILSGKKSFSMGEQGFLPKLGFPQKWDFDTTKTVFKGVLLGVILYGVLQIIGFISIQAGYPLGSSDTSEMIGTSSVFMMFVMASFLVPIAEEVFFRGYLFGFLAYPMDKPGTLRKVSALIVSSVIFGIMHFQGMSTFTDIFILIWLTIVGFIFGLAYLKTGNLMTAIGAHIGYNGISAISMYIFL